MIFLKTSFLPKTNEIIVRISAHYIKGRNPDNNFVFGGRNDVFLIIKSFRFLLTFLSVKILTSPTNQDISVVSFSLLGIRSL